jgi:hypothetical protein
MSEHTIDDVIEVAGSEIVDELREVIKSDEAIVDWFYSPHDFLKGKSPHEIYNDGNSQGIEHIERISYTLRSGQPA